MNPQEHPARFAEPFHLLMIAGGGSGLATALETPSRDHPLALVEARDFAKGTSSRSTKLIHGGVRYLALVREILCERGLFKNTPHLEAGSL